MVLPLDIILVRHGESEGNLAMCRGKSGDRSVFGNIHFRKKHSSLYRLTSNGISQAKMAGDWIRKNLGVIDEFYCSEYIRAMETAVFLNFPYAKWRVDFQLRERDWGSREFQPFEVRMKYRHAIENKLQSFYFVPSRGESIAHICSRLTKILSALHSKYSDRRVVIVCHSYVMRAFRVLLENISQAKYRSLAKGFEDKSSPNYINNGQIFHYTRRDPYTQRLGSKILYMRSVNPRDPNCPSNSQWVRMKNIAGKHTNEDLLKTVNSVPRILDNSSPSPISEFYSSEKFEIPKEYDQGELEVSGNGEGSGDEECESEEEEDDEIILGEISSGEKKVISDKKKKKVGKLVKLDEYEGSILSELLDEKIQIDGIENNEKDQNEINITKDGVVILKSPSKKDNVKTVVRMEQSILQKTIKQLIRKVKKKKKVYSQ